ncbi:MAG: LuxR C-terminal-related transcriptional regulator, partial [Bacteroidota bacterium]|nr:LuxR C-terminal-related transcriptional regulator [Bacteroidota bacterium]
LQTVQISFEKVTSGEGHALFIMGEAGIGKSSLVKAFLKSVKTCSYTYTALCDFLFTPRPLGPIYDLALQISDSLAEAMRTTPSRTELFALFAKTLAEGAKTSVIVIEDIHWADEATLDFIKFFARRIQTTNCLLLLTFRDDEITPHHPLNNILGELTSTAFTRIHLAPLSKESVHTLACNAGYKGEDVYAITGGNPFYVSEVLASYSTGIPENVKDTILSVYNRQNEITRKAWQLLAIMPEGLEYNYAGTIDERWLDAFDESLSKGIAVLRNDRLYFKHELYRRTIEASLSPIKQLELNKRVLTYFLSSFQETGEVQRIVHYAKNAAEKKLVFQFAPLAAKHAAAVGAHTEAAKLYLAALENAPDHDSDKLVSLYEAYLYECYLTNQIQEAIRFQEKALQVWQKKEATLQIGNSYRFLSRLWWFTGHRQEAEYYGLKAVQIFEALPVSKEKAMAFSNMSQLKMLSDEADEAVRWGQLAIEMAHLLGDDEILCHALNNVGTAQWKIPALQNTGRQNVEKSLLLSLRHSYHEHAARAYTNLISNNINSKDYPEAERYLAEGLHYCEERDLHSWIRYKLAWKAKLLLEKGAWQQAEEIAKRLTAAQSQVNIVKIGALTVQAVIAMRKGKPEGLSLLKEAKALAIETKEHQRIIPVLTACFEYEWLTGNALLTEPECTQFSAFVKSVNNPFVNMEAIYWWHKARPEDTRCGVELKKLDNLLQTETLLAKAHENWKSCPYEKALFLFEGADEEKHSSLLLLDALGATTTAEKLRNLMRQVGIKRIPRGLRTSTKDNAANLTTRELDILRLLKTGARNKEIASRLYISPKTVDHHISSILFKLEVPSRIKAVDEAEKLGVFK